LTAENSAPDLNQPGLIWFNVPKPLTLGQVFGRILILDFWTFSCINCLHILPALRRIERALKNDVVILGVHSPNFPYERDAKHVERAISRYQIDHPVVHDPDFKLWDSYKVKVWPTLIMVSPEGQVFARQAGEPDADRLLEAVGNAVRKYKVMGKLRSSETELTKPAKEGGILKFPGKMKSLIYKGAQHWVVANAGYHQIIVLDDQGTPVLRIGRGAAGYIDGEFNRAAFDNPHGIATAEDTIYVGDLGNHAIREINLKTEHISTIAGVGRRGLTLTKEVNARDSGLASPFDLLLLDNRLIFTNTGTHQIAEINLTSGMLRPLAGSGVKELLDENGRKAKLAQPSGLALSPDKKTLYFADSDNSSIRSLNLETGDVKILAGRGMAESGRKNGAFGIARFQHPMGILWFQDALLAVDTFNTTLRKLDLKTQTVENWGADFTCADPVATPIGYPEGAVWDGKDCLFIVDSTAHRIVVYNLAEKTWKTWVGA
jgi:thiol-disulfide isomerase/thioredoxin